MSAPRPVQAEPVVRPNRKATESWQQYIERLLQHIDALEARIAALETP